ncbi:MAG: hypothetical protein ACI90V_005740 [Bacillariaceae sp.]
MNFDLEEWFSLKPRLDGSAHHSVEDLLLIDDYYEGRNLFLLLVAVFVIKSLPKKLLLGQNG